MATACRFGVTHVVGASAGVVDADIVAGFAAKQLDDRLAGRFAEQVPQSDVDGRVAPGLGAGRTEAQIADEIAGDAVDGQWILAEQARGDIVVDVGFDRPDHKKGFAEADDALVGFHLDPEDVGELRGAGRFRWR